MTTRRLQRVWRELFEGPPFEQSVRSAFAQRVLGWALLPFWILALLLSIAGAALMWNEKAERVLPVALLIAGLAYVTYLYKRALWLRAAAALSVTMFATIAAAVLLNGVHAPVYQGGIVLLAFVVSFFGTRWALTVGLALIGVGALELVLDHAGILVSSPPPPQSLRLLVYSGHMLLSLLVLGGMQRLLADALQEARRQHREADAAREAEEAGELAFHAMFDQASIGMIALDGAGNIVRLNERAMHWLGAGEAQLVGHALSAAPLWNDAQRQLLSDAVSAAGAGNASQHELTVSGSLGVERVYQINLSPFHAHNGGVGRVIVEVVEVSDLVRTRTMLAQARRLEALGKLSGGVAHDINNMLTAIQGASDLLRTGRELDRQRIETSRDIIQSSVARASSLTRQLLAFGRQDRFESVDIDVHRLVRDMGKLFERTLHKNIAVRVVTTYEPLYMRGDLPALENALLNLALNAQDAMPNGGTLTVSSRDIELDQPLETDSSSDLEPGPTAMIRVSDTGVGMSEAVRERMFEPFFTTKPAGKGTGLGLPAVHGTVRAHRGAISVHSQEGIGSTFDLYFPAAAAPQKPVRVAEDRSTAPSLSARVLVADDEPLVRDALVAILVVAGCEVQVVCSGEALVEALAAGASPDVIVTDLMMPGLSGRNLVQTLEATLPGCPLLLITGFTGDDVSTAITGRSNHRVLRKPIAQADLIRALRELLPEHIPSQLRAQTA